jgi:subtilisin
MTAKTNGGRASEQSPRTSNKAGGRKLVGSRPRRYMIAPTGPDLPANAVIERLQSLREVEIVRTLAGASVLCPPVIVAEMAAEKADQLRRSAGGKLVIEPDQPLLAASARTASPSPTVVATAGRHGFTVTIQIIGEDDDPVENAEVQLVGRHWSAQGLTGADGRITLNLYGETADSVRDLLVKPRADHWGAWRRYPLLQSDGVNTVALRPLPENKRFDWGAEVLHFDRLPAEIRGAGVKLALIDGGIATSNAQLSAVKHGFAVTGDDEDSWSEDPTGHGTACSGIIAASDTAHCIGGFAPDAELHACKLPEEAYCSDLVAALDYCIRTNIDLACIGFGCRRGSVIVAQRLATAKRQGIAVIAAAGSIGEAVQFPACSQHVLAVAAVGQSGAFADDSPHAAYVEHASRVRGGLFVPTFSCRGPEIDLCAPGVAVIACQSPDGYVAKDGTSLAAAHVAALAALVLAHGADFQRGFARRDARKVERLFQLLKGTARMIGHPLECGAGIPDALRALGLGPQADLHAPAARSGLHDMRHALRLAGLHEIDGGVASGEPPRGPAAVMQAPLNVTPPLMPAASGATKGRVSELQTAMKLAGLA